MSILGWAIVIWIALVLVNVLALGLFVGCFLGGALLHEWHLNRRLERAARRSTAGS